MVFTEEFVLPAPDIKEIARYMGGADSKTYDILKSCLDEYNVRAAFSHKVCYCILPVKIYEKKIDFSLFCAESADLAKNLCGCTCAAIFSATVGMEADRLITKYSKTSPVKALVFQAIGTERIESLCDEFCKSLGHEWATRPRFSPGYGDLDISLQKEIFCVLDCGRKIGLYLNESMFMTPTKSVSAIVGLKALEKHNENT